MSVKVIRASWAHLAEQTAILEFTTEQWKQATGEEWTGTATLTQLDELAESLGIEIKMQETGDGTDLVASLRFDEVTE